MTIFSNLFGNTDGATQTSLDTVDTNVDAVLVDTGTSIPNTLASLATQASVNTVDTVVDRIEADTQNIQGTVGAILTDTNEVQGDVNTLAARLTSPRASLLDNLSRLDANVSTGGIKSVQTGGAEVNGGLADRTQLFNISAVNTAKSIIIINGFMRDGSEIWTPRTTFVSSTQIRVGNVGGTTQANEISYQWFVVEFA